MATAPIHLRTLLEALAGGGVEFVVCGGVACVLHGVARVTNDLDICVRMSEENLARLVKVCKLLNLTPRTPEPIEALCDPEARIAWIQTKGAMVFTLTAPDQIMQLDVFLQYPIAYDDLVRDAVRMTEGELSVLTSSREHLIEAKSAVSPLRRVDQRDIEDLQELIRRDQQR